MIGMNNLGKIGRLGNQMFQFASLVGIAENNNLNFRIPDCSKIKWNNYEKDVVEKGYHQLQHCFEMNNLSEDNLGTIDGKNYDVFYGEHRNFDENLYSNCADNINIRGYLENYKYFIKVESKIRQYYQFKENIIKKSIDYFNKFNIKNPICIIVRRGDYIQHNKTHPLLNIDYYKKSVDFLGQDRNYLIISDDINWCKKTFIGEKYSFVDYTPEKIYKGHFDMCVGSLCSDFIISNSTFAWWTSWLSENPNKKVCAPANWFHGNNKNLDTSGYYLNNFVKINNQILNFSY